MESVADELNIDVQLQLKDNPWEHWQRQKRRIHAHFLQDLCHIKKKETSFSQIKYLKHSEGRQCIFVCEDLHKLLKILQRSCSDTFTCCYARNGNKSLGQEE